MSYRPHGRAEVDSSSPRAFGVCDRCGMWYNHYKLSWQREWAGTTQLNLHILVCEMCLDELQPQLRTVILPPDPPSIINARVETFSLDEGFEDVPTFDATGKPTFDSTKTRFG